VSLADTLERAGIVFGSILMVALPASVLLNALSGAGTPWWGPLLLLAPGFVVGWAAVADWVPFDYDAVWFVCFFGYVLAVAALAVLDLQPIGENRAAALAVSAAAFVVAAVVDYYRS
jgi:hypothetical protein